MQAILQLLAGILTGKAGEQIGSAVSWAAQVAALTAALAPAALWLTKNKDAEFVVITYGDLAFWGGLIGVAVFLAVRLVHHAPPPS